MLVLSPCLTPRAALFLPLALGARPTASFQERADEARAPATEPALAQGFSRAEDVTGAGLAFVELVTVRDTVLLGEPFVLRLRIGIQRELLQHGLVQLFQRPLDVPVQVFAPALERVEGALFLDPELSAAGASFVLGEGLARATRAPDLERDGRSYALFELERRVAATRPGALRFEAPTLGFARATRFADDFVLGSVPLDRRDEFVRGTGASLTVLALPEEGRPLEFSGAIGRYTIRAEAEPRALAAGESLALCVTIEAEGTFGDLSQCPPPSVAELEGFHLRGSLVERELLRLVARYDLVPRASGSLSVPPIRFAFFDVTPPAGYRTIATQPIALVVHPAEASSTTSTIPTPISASPSAQPRPFAWIAALVLAGLALGFWVRRARQ